MKSLVTALFLLLISFSARAQKPCFEEGARFLALSYPQAINLFDKLTVQKEQSKNFIFCDHDGLIYETVGTFVHENIHKYDSQLGLADASHHFFYLLLDQRTTLHIPRLPEFLDPNHFYEKIAPLYHPDEDFMGYVSTYIVDSGKQMVLVLFDELNAYTHALEAAARFPVKTEGALTYVDSTLASMVSVLRYYQYFHTADPSFYQNVLLSDAVKPVVAKLLHQARETVIATADRRDLRLNAFVWGAALGDPLLETEWAAIGGKTTPLKPDLRFLNLQKIQVNFEKLQNGNTLVSYSWKNRLYEIEMDGEEKPLSYNVDHQRFVGTLKIGAVMTTRGLVLYNAADNDLGEILQAQSSEIQMRTTKAQAR